MHTPRLPAPSPDGELTAYLSLAGAALGRPRHSGEADVELLDDGRVQTVEVQEEDELVVEA